MKRLYKYRFPRRTKLWTVLYFVIFLGVVIALNLLYAGGYLSAWFVVVVISLFALMALSIPRKILVYKTMVQIHCILDLTEIPRIEIVSVRNLPKEEAKFILPLLGVCGFFGYYGYFFDWSSFEKVKVYASEWDNLVEIVDKYERRYVVSCDDASTLIEELTSTIAANDPYADPEEGDSDTDPEEER